jgi:fumarate reductase flavoprotein subunit
MNVVVDPHHTFADRVPVAIVGAGACGLTAALAAAEAGVETVVFERDAKPYGLTGMSTGQIPAAGTRFQRAKGIEDSPDILAADLIAEARGENDPAMVRAVARLSGPTVEWLASASPCPSR